MNLMAETELRTTTGTPAIAYEYVWFNGHPAAQIDFGTTTHWTFTDHLGTPLLQTDSGGNTYWRAEYEPYGKIFALRTGDQHQPLRLPGQEAEQLNLLPNGATERSYNVFRWYRPGWGRYTQPDPISQPRFLFETGGVSPPFASKDGTSLFAYVSGNPMRYSDPLGLARVANCGCKPVPASGNPGPGQGTGPQVNFMIPADCKVYGAGNPIPGTGNPGVTDIDFINGEKYRGTDTFPTWYIYDDCNGGFTASLFPPFTGVGVGAALPFGLGSLVPPGPIPGCCCKKK
jgi:RHS repeat-associated protein